jgi:hypothetical protein
VENTLAGAVENEEHSDGLRMRKELDDTENLIRDCLIIYTFYLILDFHGHLIDIYLLQEYMNCSQAEKLSCFRGRYSQHHGVNLDRKIFFEVFL